MTFSSRTVQGFSFALFFVVTAFLTACNSLPDKPWQQAVPESSSILYVFESGGAGDAAGSFSEILEADFFTFLEAVGSTPPATITEIENVAGNQLLPLGLYTEAVQANQLSHVWISRLTNEAGLAELAENFSRELTENEYRFQGQRIHRLFLQDGQLYYAAQLGEIVLLSTNSTSLENGIRSYLDLDDTLSIAGSTDVPGPGIYVNFSGLSRQLQQLGKVAFRPYLKDSFTGLQPAKITTSQPNERLTRLEARLETSSRRSAFVQAITAAPRRFNMTRYISSDAAVFAMFSAPRRFEERTDLPRETPLDSLLVDRQNRISAFTSTLGDEAAMAGFYTLGFSPLNETVFLRRVSDRSTLRGELERLVADGHGTRTQNTYTFRSETLAKILGGDLCVYQNFTAGIVEDLLVLSPRSGLIQRVQNDIDSRRVMYYDDDFTELMGNLPERQSAFLYADNASFPDFIEPYTDPVSPAMAYMPYFDVLTMSFVAGNEGRVDATAHLHQLDRNEQPLVERWYYPLPETRLTGPPAVGRLSGGIRNDIVLATSNNQVTALASDGTRVFQASTGNDRPVGSPVLVDWYANNQTAVLLAAGNKVYGWNNRGQALPNFPFELDERITAPILTADISRSGSPEVLVATADRQLHVLGGRGRNLNGWPQTTNGVIRDKPAYELVEGRYSIWATAENAVFSWRSDGTPRDGFPLFADAPLNGSLHFYDDHIFVGGQSGYLYAISREGLLDERLAVADVQQQGASGGDSYRLEAVDVAASPVRVSGVQQLRVSIPAEEGSGEDEAAQQEENAAEVQRMPVIVTNSENGSVFLYSLEGQLRFTASIGRNMAENHQLNIADLNQDGKQELLAVANVGRLYAWTIEDEERFSGLPSASVQHPVVSQLGTDGLLNIIAGTNEGIRVWAISN